MRRKYAALTCLGAAILLLAACTSSGSSGQEPASGTSTQASGTPISLGLIGAFTGTFASSSGQVPAIVKAWAADVNANGGLHGHPVKIVVKDMSSGASASLTAVKEMVTQDQIAGLIDFDNADLTWASYVESAGVPVVGGLQLYPGFGTNPSYFPVGANYVAELWGLQQVAKTYGGKMGVLVCAEAPACGGVLTIMKALSNSTGLQLPVAAKVSSTATNYTASCQQLKDAGVQSYSVFSSAAIVGRIVQECSKAGLTAQYIASGGVLDAAKLGIGDFAGTSPAEPEFVNSTPGMKKYHEVTAKYAGPSFDPTRSPHNIAAWASAALFEKAVSTIPPGTAVTAGSVTNALYTLKDETLDGVTPPLTFVKGKPTVVLCYYTFAYKNSQFSANTDSSKTCAPSDVVQPIVNNLAK